MSINDFINTKVLLISLSLIIFIQYIMENNIRKIIIKN